MKYLTVAYVIISWINFVYSQPFIVPTTNYAPTIYNHPTYDYGFTHHPDYYNRIMDPLELLEQRKHGGYDLFGDDFWENRYKSIKKKLQRFKKHKHHQHHKQHEQYNNLQDEIAKGTGGVTLVTYGEKHRFAYKNGIKHNCTLEKTDSKAKTYQCENYVSRNHKANICFDNRHVTRVGKMFCYGDNISMNCNNGNCTCSGGKQYSLKTLRRKCGSTFGTKKYIEYIYMPSEKDPKRISLEKVKCEGKSREHNMCIWFGPLI